VKNIICGNHQLKVAGETAVTNGSCHTTLKEDFGMCQVSAKFEPRLLISEEQKTTKSFTKCHY
jgi:hypothetical protein